MGEEFRDGSGKEGDVCLCQQTEIKIRKGGQTKYKNNRINSRYRRRHYKQCYR